MTSGFDATFETCFNTVRTKEIDSISTCDIRKGELGFEVVRAIDEM